MPIVTEIPPSKKKWSCKPSKGGFFLSSNWHIRMICNLQNIRPATLTSMPLNQK